MSTMGTFDGFTTARLGIYAAQLGLQVTGNNVSNINTEGYTRQRIDQVSFKAGAYDRYRSQLDNHVGSGALVMDINQIRDPYLDVRYRNTSAEVGYSDRMLAGLKDIQDILDEVGLGEDASSNEKGDGIIHAQLQKLADELRKFEKEPTDLNDTLVRNAAETLCSLFNKYANKLDTLYKETTNDFYDQVTEINECLTNIRDLNREIRDCEVYGDNALELRDERNRQIDTLSQYIHIKAVYTEEEIGGGQTVEKLSIYLDSNNPDPYVHTDRAMLIDGVFGAQLYEPKTMPVINPNYTTEGDPTEGYLYLMEVKAGEPDPYDPDNILTQDTVFGTNDPTLATQVRDNDYFGVQFTKLVDVNGKEWEGVTTKYDKVPAEDLEDWDEAEAAKQAVYKFTVKGSAAETWGGVTSIQIGDKVLTVGTDITADQLANPAQLAQKIADNLTSPTADGYNITVDNGMLVYTAVNPGRVGKSGPAAAPKLTFVPGTGDAADAKITSTLEESFRGAEATRKPPADETTVDKNGTETTTSYTQMNGAWYKVITETRHTYETALNDNDTYGSLQAVRELLTEKGEFAKKSTIDDIDKDAAKKRGIPYYQMSLDLLAQKFAEVYNSLNQGIAVDQNGDPIKAEEVKEIPKLKVVEKTVGGETIKEVWEYVGIGMPDTDANGYKKKGDWSVDGQEYCTDKIDGKTYYTGLHESTGFCIITGKIPVAKWDADGTIENSAEVFAGLEATGYRPDARLEIKNESDPVKKERMIADLLKDCLRVHGVQMDHDTSTIPTVTIVDKQDADVEGTGPLFSNRNDRDDTAGITAANISVSHSWSTGKVKLVPTFTVLFPDANGDLPHTTQNDNAGHMLNMIEKELLFNPQELDPEADSNRLFVGNFNDMFNNISVTLGKDQRESNIGFTTSYGMLVDIDTSRDGVSGVDLNDEAMNMMQYQKALNAAMRMMTVIDESLDRLINNTGVAGR